jgi:hypothetical protein
VRAIGGRHMNTRPKSTNRKVIVSKTKIPNAPWEEDKYIYDIKTGSDSIWHSSIYVVILQMIVGIITFIWVYNSL